MALHSLAAWLVALVRRCVLALAVFLATAMPSQAQTLETVRARGYLICGASDILPGFAQQVEGKWSGFDVDFCRAVAAAALGDPDMVEFRPLSGESRFVQLQIGNIDVLARNAPWTMRRDTTFGARYVTTIFFDGQAFMVPQALGIVSAFELDDISVCAIEGSEQLTRLREFFFENQATYSEVLYEDLEDLGAAYGEGLCDAVSGPARWLHALRRSLLEPAAHRILPERISKELLGPVVRAGDEQWFNLVRWTFYALLEAEELGVTSINLDQMAAARNPAIQRLLGLEGDFGAPFGLAPDFMARVVRAVGNYAELYDRNFGPETGPPLLRGQNSLWSNGGLLYAPPIR